MNSVSQWVTDSGQTPPSPLPTALYTNQNLLTAINDACGLLESACLRGQAYSPSDLSALASQVDGNGNPGVSGQYLKRILSDITAFDLVTRRFGPNPPQTVLEAYNRAMDQLDALSRGERIFSFVETAEAGVATTQQMSQIQPYENNLITARWSAYWGTRQAERRFW